MRLLSFLTFPLLLTVNVGGQSSTTLIKVRTSDTVKVDLPSNPSTGFKWSVSNREGTAQIDSVRHAYLKTAVGIPSLGGVDRWEFKAVASGTVKITFVYQRPWDKGKPAMVREYVVEVGD